MEQKKTEGQGQRDNQILHDYSGLIENQCNIVEAVERACIVLDI